MDYGVGLDPSDIVLDWDLDPAPQKRSKAPNFFCQCLLRPNGWMDQDATWYDGRPRPRQHCVRCGPSSTAQGHGPQIFGPCLLWRNGRPSQLLL